MVQEPWGEEVTQPMPSECSCCHPDLPWEGRLCRNCFMVWYDSGITSPAVLSRETVWRRVEGYWPWGKVDEHGNHRSPTIAQIRELHGETT